MIHSKVRQLTIDMITDQPNELLEWFNDLWSKLIIVEKDVYHMDGGEIIYYLNDDDCNKYVFFLDIRNDKFYCDSEHFWEKLINYLGYCETDDIISVIHLLLNTVLKIDIPTPIRKFASKHTQINLVL